MKRINSAAQTQLQQIMNAMKEKILITSATGKTGFPATVQLLKDGYPVRILVRSKNAKAVELEKLGAEVAIGSLTDYAELTNALQNIKRVYYCYPLTPGLLDGTKMFVKAATAQNIEAIVNMGQWLAEFDDQKSVHTNQVKESYKVFERSGLNVVHIIPGFFADNMLFVIEFSIQLGLMFVPHGSGKNPAISNEDLGRVIAALLKNPTPYFGKRLRPTGPHSLSSREMAEIFSKVIGHKVMYINMPIWLFVKGAFKSAKEFGLSAFTISQVRHYFREYQLNKFDIGGSTNVVKELTGKEPDDFETIVKRWIARSPYKQRNFSNWLSAMRKFMEIPFQPVPSMNELEKLNK
jgi:NAD(P)H dehydrogenase (quinone)